MSRTDKTDPLWLVEMRGECHRAGCSGYPCRHIAMSGTLTVLKRAAHHRSRRLLREDLAHGREPSTAQHRHSALWDLV
jgi:hypothetical protein